MSAPDDHAVLGGHQFLDVHVLVLHVKVGIAPAACPAAPSTVKVDENIKVACISDTVRIGNRQRELRIPRVTAPDGARRCA